MVKRTPGYPQEGSNQQVYEQSDPQESTTHRSPFWQIGGHCGHGFFGGLAEALATRNNVIPRADNAAKTSPDRIRVLVFIGHSPFKAWGDAP